MARGRSLGNGRLLRRPGSATWTLDYRDADGRRHFKALGTDRRQAEVLRARLVHQRDLVRFGLLDVAGQELPVSELVARYIEDLLTRVVERHAEQVEARLKRLLERLGPVTVSQLKPADVVRARSEAIARGVGNRSANLVVDSLRAAFTWAESMGLVATNPVTRIKRLPEAGHERRRRRALTEDEVQRLLAAADADDRRCAGRYEVDGRVRVPQRPMLQFLIETGVRYGEARQLVWADMDLKERLVVVRPETAKARRQRVVPIRTAVADELRALRILHERALGRLPGSNDAVFLGPDGLPHKRPTTNARRVLHRLLRRAGIVRVDSQGRSIDIHSLRATCGTRLARSGAGLAQAQRILGHSDPKLTAKHYVMLGIEDLRGAVEGVERVGRCWQATVGDG